MKDVLMDHLRSPRFQKPLEDPTIVKQWKSRYSETALYLELVVEKNVIKDIHFKVTGSAAAQVSASLSAGLVSGKSIESVKYLCHRALQVFLFNKEWPEEFDSIKALKSYQNVPHRSHCVVLFWEALLSALHDLRVKQHEVVGI